MLVVTSAHTSGVSQSVITSDLSRSDDCCRYCSETIATLPGGWDLAHAIRLRIKLFAELGANSEALSGFQVDSPSSSRAIFESAPEAMLQSLCSAIISTVAAECAQGRPGRMFHATDLEVGKGRPDRSEGVLHRWGSRLPDGRCPCNGDQVDRSTRDWRLLVAHQETAAASHAQSFDRVRAADYSLVGLVKPSGPMERRRVRRPLTDSELRTLIETTKTAPHWRGLSGLDRSLLYAIASMTGFRRGELMSLTPESFRLDTKPPAIVCEAGYTKNGQLAEQSIPDSLASVLRPWVAGKPARRPVFDRMTAWTALMLRLDLERCGIPFKDDSGRVVDLHALRHTYITALGRAGLPIKVHQTLARHSDPKLTLNVYTHLSLHDTTEAVESLPDPFQAPPQAQAMAATGTDPSINDRLAHHLPTGQDGDSRIGSDADASAEAEILPLLSRKPLEETGEDGFDRLESHGVAKKKNSRKNGPRPITDLVLLVHS